MQRRQHIRYWKSCCYFSLQYRRQNARVVQRTPAYRILQRSWRWSIRWLLLSYRRRRRSWYRFCLGAYERCWYDLQLYLTSGVGCDEFGRVGNRKTVGKRNSISTQHVIANMQRTASDHRREKCLLKLFKNVKCKKHGKKLKMLLMLKKKRQ